MVLLQPRFPKTSDLARHARTLFTLLLGLFLGLGIPLLARAADKSASSDEWPEITAEELSLTSIPQDPEAEAVILRVEREGKMVKPSDEWVNQLKYRWRMKVLKPSGRRFGEVHIRGEKYSRVSNIEAKTIKPDGTVVPVSEDQIFDRTVFQVGDYKVTEKVFNFPAVEPGVILEYSYDRYDNYFFSLAPWYFEGEVFTVYSRFSQSVPNGFGYMILCDLCEGATPEVSKWRAGKQKGETYTVILRDLPGYRREDLMPPARDVSPRLEMVLQTRKNIYFPALGRQDSLFIDWPSVGKYAAFYYERAIKDGQGAIKSVAEEWVQGITDADEKIRAVFRHVQEDFRYISWPRVVGGTRSIETILKQKTADNEEKAVLLLAALRALGVDGFPVLVSGKNEGSLNPKFFSLTQFTHTVAGIPRPGGTVRYLDPTVAYAPFGFVSWRDSGADALFLRGEGPEVGKLPVKNELNMTKYKITLKPRPDAKADLEIEARFSGEDAIDMREELVPASETGRVDYLKRWLSRARAGTVLLSQTMENLDKVDEPLVLNLKAEASGLVTLAEGIEVVQGCVLFCFDSNPISRAARQHPFYVDRGWNVSQEVLIVPPEGMKAAPVPLGRTAKSPIGTLTMRCVSHDEAGVECTEHFIARRARWSAADRDEIRAMYDEIVEADRMAVSFQEKGAGK